jgi:hypothetical protein
VIVGQKTETMCGKEKAERINLVVFVAGFVAMVLALGFVAVTKRIELGALIFVSVGWCVMATSNAVTFYTGVFRWKSGPTFTREENPWGFYLSAIPFLVFSMTVLTFLVIKAIQSQ